MTADAVADRYAARVMVDAVDRELSAGFSIERISNVRAQDRFEIACTDFAYTDLAAGDFLDSVGNGGINNADRDAHSDGGDLALDLDQLFQPEANEGIDLGDQHLILERIASINADKFV